MLLTFYIVQGNYADSVPEEPGGSDSLRGKFRLESRCSDCSSSIQVSYASRQLFYLVTQELLAVL